MNILVSAISGNLGQAIAKTIRKHYGSYTIIGTDAVNPLQGYGLCNKLIKVPYANDINFINYIQNIVSKLNIDLIIPCNDSEVEVLMTNDLLNQITLATKFNTRENIIDKYNCYIEFQKYGIEFCRTYLPSNYKLEFENSIAKPRKGSGSKGIIKNPHNFHSFDDNYIIQEFKEGLELTIPFYANLNNELLGFLPLIKYGNAPNNCYQTYTQHNKELSILILQIINSFELKGPCNLQCIINKEGIYPFEMNFRYSGSVDIQDKLGLDILRIGIEEFKSNKAYMLKPNVKYGFAIRQYHSEVFLNKDIFDENNFEIE
jgi:carbamoyl-phosphate synthase large subunit